MRTKRKPIVGETLYSLNVGNAARHCPQVLTPVFVKSVGRKYFTTWDGKYESSSTQFHLDTWSEKSDYSPNQALYETEQEWADEKERDELMRFLAKIFTPWNPALFKLDQLRRVKAIVEEDKP